LADQSSNSGVLSYWITDRLFNGSEVAKAALGRPAPPGGV
jgi:hypothetical protein